MSQSQDSTLISKGKSRAEHIKLECGIHLCKVVLAHFALVSVFTRFLQEPNSKGERTWATAT